MRTIPRGKPRSSGAGRTPRSGGARRRPRSGPGGPRQGILAKTKEHVRRRILARGAKTEISGSFRPEITPYSSQLKRTEPIHERLFRVSEQHRQNARCRGGVGAGAWQILLVS